MNKNVVVLCGRLGKDPDMRFTANGSAVCNFSIAITDYRKKKDDSGYEPETTWVDITAWTRLAEKIAAQTQKGTEVIVEGSLRTRSWDDQDGTKHFRTYVLARDVQFGDGRVRAEEGEADSPNASRGDANPASNSESSPTPDSGIKKSSEEEEDDLPF